MEFTDMLSIQITEMLSLIQNTKILTIIKLNTSEN